jgi:hypothetical protein
MTGDVKKEVYNSISGNYIKSLDIILNEKKSKFIEISKAIIISEKLLQYISKNDKKNLSLYSSKINANYKSNGLKSLQVSFFPLKDTTSVVRSTISSTLRSKSQIFGIEVQQNGVFITLIQPVLYKGKFIGLVELKESIHSLRMNFEKHDNNFVFLLDKKMLAKLSLRTKSGRYKNVINQYLVYQSAYSSRFYSKITDNGEESFNKAVKEKNDSDNVFFRTYKSAVDINGAEIGLYVIGEQIEKNNGFVNITDKMVKSVTMVSLGLVISILLFMF